MGNRPSSAHASTVLAHPEDDADLAGGRQPQWIRPMMNRRTPPAGGRFVAVTSPTYQRLLCRTRMGSGSSRMVLLPRLAFLAIVDGVRRPQPPRH